MTSATIAIAGLALTAAGALLSARGALLTKQQADQLSGTYWDQNIPLRDALVKQSRWAAAGLMLIGVGTILQIVALI